MMGHTPLLMVIAGWVDENDIEVLNVAGPRASKDPGIHDFVMGLLERVWSA